MSGSSFPRPEHITLLRQKIAEQIRERHQTIQVEERGLNHYKCQYRFGLRRGADEEWVELAIHFQLADRLETSGNEAELSRMLEGFLNRHFAGGPSNRGEG